MRQITGDRWTAGRAHGALRTLPVDRRAYPGRADSSLAASGRAHVPRTARRGPLRRSARRVVRWIIAGCIVIAAASAIAPARQLIAATVGTADDAAIAVGLGLDTIVVSGQRFTTDTDVYDCLDLARTRTLISLDSIAAKRCIETLPWIASAGLTRVYPGRLDVTIAERRPFAVWDDGQRTMLVDRTGRILAAATGHGEALLKITGDGAPQAAVALAEALAHVPAIAGRLDGATRKDGRRWSLLLPGNVRIELPAEGEATALADLLRHREGPTLLSRADTVIDLRSRFEIASRPARVLSGPISGGGG